MMIYINDDFGSDDYQVEAWKGFDARELAAIALAAAAAAALCVPMVFIRGMDTGLSLMLAFACVSPLLYACIWKSPTGQPFLTYRKACRYRKRTRDLPWRAGEYPAARARYDRAAEDIARLLLQADGNGKEGAASPADMRRAWHRHWRKEQSAARKAAGRGPEGKAGRLKRKGGKGDGTVHQPVRGSEEKDAAL